MPSSLVVLCRADEVDEDIPVQASHAGRDYAVFLKDGAFYVTQDLCTHGPGLMSDGFIEGCEVECSFHQGKFNFITGEATSAPCTAPLRIWTACVQDSCVCIDPDEHRA